MRPTVDATRQQVLVERLEGVVPRARQVHLHAVDQVLERTPRQVECAHERLQAASLRGGRRAVEAPADLLPPLVERGLWRPLSRLVHRVVHHAAEIPDGDDRVALGCGKHEERVVETGVSGHGTDAHLPDTCRPARVARGFSPALANGLNWQAGLKSCSTSARAERNVKSCFTSVRAKAERKVLLYITRHVARGFSPALASGLNSQAGLKSCSTSVRAKAGLSPAPH